MSNITIKCNLSEDLFREQLIKLGWTPPEPKEQFINIDKLINSNIDVEFKSGSLWRIGNLEKIDTLQGYYYKDKDTNPYTKCRIRQDHWHHCAGSTCPLPEGLEINYRIIFKGSPIIEENSTIDYHSLNWNLITGFKVIGVADGWKYRWEK